MKQLRIQARKWLRRYNRMARRERILIFTTVVVAYLGLTYLGYLGLESMHEKLNQQLSTEGILLKALELELKDKEAQAVLDPEAGRRELLARLAQEEENAEQDVTNLTRNIIKPEQMTQMVKGMLAGDPALRVVAFENLPPESFLRDEADNEQSHEADANEGEQAEAAEGEEVQKPEPETLIYKHAIRLQVQGHYLDLLAYLQALENLPLRLFWSEAELEVKDAPMSALGDAPTGIVSLSIYTLSLDKKWAKGA